MYLGFSLLESQLLDKMTKEEHYLKILTVIRSVITKESHPLSNLANFCAIIKEEFNFHWVGFYLIDSKKEKLYLGPFQGPLACTEIPSGKGVCGSAWSKQETLIVPDVHKFEGHIACSSLTNSEIVLPFTDTKMGEGVLDIDSIEFNAFDEIDQKYLLEALALIP